MKAKIIVMDMVHAYTLGSTYNEFCYNEHPSYNDHFLLHAFICFK